MREKQIIVLIILLYIDTCQTPVSETVSVC